MFIDESGCNIAMTRDYGRGLKGQRVPGRKSSSWGDNVTMIGAMDTEGIRAMMTIGGGTSGDVFMAYVKEVLAPTLNKGDIVVMDNLSAHKVPGIREQIEAAGATVVYLPPYSPDYNPIEPCWSKLKSILKSIGARTREELEDAVKAAMHMISPSDATGWFKHCGYATR